MDIHVPIGVRGDRTRQVYRAVADAIVDGRLRAGEALPPSRRLAADLGVSRTTVAAAYDRLLAEGFTIARQGAGTFVAPGPVPAAERAAPRRAPRGGAIRPRELWTRLPRLPDRHRPIAYDFAIGQPDPGLFPLAAWRRALLRELHPGGDLLGGYAGAAGHSLLRAAIARHLGLARGVRADADDVVVTSGAQQGFDLLTRVLVAPGDVVAVEEPGYPPVRGLLASHGAHIVPVPVDAEGLVVDALPPRARLVYTTPSHQFPTGVRMSLDRRRALLAWAEAAGAVIVEDDYDSEYRYGPGSLDPLQTLDRTGHVVYVGTFSKSLLPTLRVGFVVAPASLRPALLAAKGLVDWHGDPATQAALGALVDEGVFAAHIRRATRVYAERRALLIDAVDRDLGRWMRVAGSAAGLHVFAEPHDGVVLDGAAIRDAAVAAGVGVDPVDAFTAVPGSRSGLVLGIGTIAAADIAPGIRRLATVIVRATAPG